MSVTIWKYPVSCTGDFVLEMPKGAQILTVQTQGGEPQLWVLVDPDEKEMVRVRFLLLATGQPVEGTVKKFIGKWARVGTFQLEGGKLVFHLFLEGEV